MTEKKMTQAQALNECLTKDLTAECKAVIEHMLEQLAKKSNSTRKTKAESEERKNLKTVLLFYLENFDKEKYPNGVTVSEIMANVEEFKPSLEMNTQKVTRLLTELATAEKVKGEIVKGKRRYMAV